MGQEICCTGGIPDWVTGTEYNVGDEFIYNGVLYTVLVAHTSTTIAADLAAGYIEIVGGEDAALTARVVILEDNEYKITYFAVVSGTSGTITFPTGATVNQNEFGTLANCVTSTITGSNKPTYITPKTAGGVPVTATLNTTTGDWVLSGTPADASIAIIYSFNIKAKDISNITQANAIDYYQTGVTSTALSDYVINGSRQALSNTDTITTFANKSGKWFSDLVASAFTDTTSASNISSGSLADARLSSNVNLLNADQTVTGIKTFQKIRYTDQVVITGNYTFGATDYHVSVNNGAITTTVTLENPTGTVVGKEVVVQRHNTGASGTVTLTTVGGTATIQTESGSRATSTSLSAATFARQIRLKATGAGNWDLIGI